MNRQVQASALLSSMYMRYVKVYGVCNLYISMLYAVQCEPYPVVFRLSLMFYYVITASITSVARTLYLMTNFYFPNFTATSRCNHVQGKINNS